MTDSLPILYPGAYAHKNEAAFSIRFAGLCYTFYCTRTNKYKSGIRKARALSVRKKIITAQPSHYWKLNTNRTSWTYCASSHIGPVPAADVVWALADNRNLIETYSSEKTIKWEVFKTLAQCYKCDSRVERQRNYWHSFQLGSGPQPGFLEKGKWFFWTPVCDKCLAKFNEIYRQQRYPFETGLHWRFLERQEVDYIASQDRSANVRWVREFVAKGSFTRTQFKALCQQYGNVCLRCEKKRPLVADHVVPIARGGSNDIANIQPLCARCNGIKSDKSTDYRKPSKHLRPRVRCRLL